MHNVDQMLIKDQLLKEDLVYLLSTTNDMERMKVFRKAAEVREKFIGNKVYLRGLIELSNICRKNCFYCGIRHDNKYISRYSLNDHDVLEVARHAWQAGYGSVIIQTGERTDKAFTNRISNLIRQIKLLSKDQLGITLSCGVQDRDTYREWFEWGAHRYLLRIETRSEALYNKLHPDDSMHSYSKRLKALEMLKRSGFHTGTGVMIGLPFQTVRDRYPYPVLHSSVLYPVGLSIIILFAE